MIIWLKSSNALEQLLLWVSLSETLHGALIYWFICFSCAKGPFRRFYSYMLIFPQQKNPQTLLFDMPLGETLEILLYCVYMTALKQLTVNYANRQTWHLTTKLTRKPICEQWEAFCYQHNNLLKGI